MNDYMAYVATKYIDEMAFTSSSNSYKGRYANLALRPDSGYVGDAVCVELLSPIYHEIKQAQKLTPNGRILYWTRVLRAIFLWGIMSDIKRLAQLIHDAENTASSGSFDCEKIGIYPKKSSAISLKWSAGFLSQDVKLKVSRDFQNLMLMTQPSDGGARQYSKVYLINMIFALFIDAGKPVEELVFL